MEDLIEQANEVQESLGRSYGVPDEVDEEDLQAGGSGFPIHPLIRTFTTRCGVEGEAEAIHRRARRTGSRRRTDWGGRDTVVFTGRDGTTGFR